MTTPYGPQLPTAADVQAESERAPDLTGARSMSIKPPRTPPTAAELAKWIRENVTETAAAGPEEELEL